MDDKTIAILRAAGDRFAEERQNLTIEDLRVLNPYALDEDGRRAADWQIANAIDALLALIERFGLHPLTSLLIDDSEEYRFFWWSERYSRNAVEAIRRAHEK